MLSPFSGLALGQTRSCPNPRTQPEKKSASEIPRGVYIVEPLEAKTEIPSVNVCSLEQPSHGDGGTPARRNPQVSETLSQEE